MQSIADFLFNLGAWNWFLIAISMLVLETLIPGVHFVWFGVAACVVGAITLLVPMPIAFQLVAFAVIALGTILMVRRFWGPETITTDEPGLNVRAHQYVGRTVTVEEPIAGGRGKVRVGDTIWTAEGPDTPRGAHVTVIGANGTVLVVAASA